MLNRIRFSNLSRIILVFCILQIEAVQITYLKPTSKPSNQLDDISQEFTSFVESKHPSLKKNKRGNDGHRFTKVSSDPNFKRILVDTPNIKIKVLTNLIQYINGQNIDYFIKKAKSGTKIRIVGVLAQDYDAIYFNVINKLLNKAKVSNGNKKILKATRKDLFTMSAVVMSYMKWIKRKNMLVVPIDSRQKNSKIESFLNHLSGVLIQGGHVDSTVNNIDIQAGDYDILDTMVNIQNEYFGHKRFGKVMKKHGFIYKPTPFAKKQFAVIQAVKKRMDNNPEISIPIHATCLGFQATLLEANRKIPFLMKVANKDALGGVNFVESKNNFVQNILGPEKAHELETKRRVYVYSHNYAVPVQIFNQIPSLRENFEVLGTYYSLKRWKTKKEIEEEKLKGVENPSPINKNFDYPLVMIYRHRKYPIFGTQFHPEKNEFEKNLNIDFRPKRDSKFLNVYVKNFLNNSNYFASVEDLEFMKEYYRSYKGWIINGYPGYDEVMMISNDSNKRMLERPKESKSKSPTYHDNVLKPLNLKLLKAAKSKKSKQASTKKTDSK